MLLDLRSLIETQAAKVSSGAKRAGQQLRWYTNDSVQILFRPDERERLLTIALALGYDLLTFLALAAASENDRKIAA